MFKHYTNSELDKHLEGTHYFYVCCGTLRLTTLVKEGSYYWTSDQLMQVKATSVELYKLKDLRLVQVKHKETAHRGYLSYANKTNRNIDMYFAHVYWYPEQKNHPYGWTELSKLKFYENGKRFY